MTIDNKIKFIPINIAVITISDSRKTYNDLSGNLLEERIIKNGHYLSLRKIIPDNINQIKETLLELSNQKKIDCIITTGGTGLTGRDTTTEAIEEIADKLINGFGELFR